MLSLVTTRPTPRQEMEML
ncbi:unnamed protein product [Acanthoscelides obtectus]|uniref:Uncharacterized protein n=1 Tax=Acanthoscelides obtectus TaxID=200917 RepID=A0A9P0K146_ACAOB|nr:unnamed protein product [Acanthoscelides obtectus]CAK1631614.1 hypothetical protein AOBTE_LOCUS7048 [Acanthoscelides obtectus]